MKHVSRYTAAALMIILMGCLAPNAVDAAPNYYEDNWVSAMNQTSYWSPWNCTKYNNHGGWIPAQYDAAIIKAGQKVRVYPNLENTGGFQASAPDGKDISWVMKCTKDQTTTTTSTTTTTTEATTTTSSIPQSTTTSTTVADTTSTAPEQTTTSSSTVPAPTTTVGESTTTSSPESTLPPETTTSTTPGTTPVTTPPSDPCIVNGERIPEGEYEIVEYPNNTGTTEWGFFPCREIPETPSTPPPPSTPPTSDGPPSTPTLPETGPSSAVWLTLLAGLLTAAGVGVTAITRRTT